MPAEPAAVPQDSTPKKEVCAPKFLAMYRTCGNVQASCLAAGIDRKTYYNWRRDDPEFDEACKHAADDALDGLEEVGWDRAKTTSDTLLIFFLKAGRPEKYQDRLVLEMLRRYQDVSDDELNDLLARRIGALAPVGEDRDPRALESGDRAERFERLDALPE